VDLSFIIIQEKAVSFKDLKLRAEEKGAANMEIWN
jgi:hypothetical protein